MECFRIDESGYTGYDLLNHDQRFQGAAAIAIEDADATRLIKEHFPNLQAENSSTGHCHGVPITTHRSSPFSVHSLLTTNV